MRIKIIHDASDEGFIPRRMAIGLVACVLAAVIACSITANVPIMRDTAEATYKGYMADGANNYHPIVEIAGIEYIALHEQPVRDNSYIGERVTISYNEGNIKDFIIEWEEVSS